MKRGLKFRRVYRGEGINFESLGAVLIVIFVFFSLALVYYLFFSLKECNSESCFYSSLDDCSKVEWIRESDDADWYYRVLGCKNDFCEVEVKLLKLKQGKIDLEELEGEKMICEVLKNEVSYPEEDISRCSGKLKEKLQEIIIQKMHDYLLENLGEIKGEFKKIG